MHVDEVQSGLGRTGTLWAHESYNIKPDMMSLAKPLAGMNSILNKRVFFIWPNLLLFRLFFNLTYG